MTETTDRALPLTDREWLLDQQEEAAAETAAMQQIQHFRALGLGAAAYVLAMWQGLECSGFTREETLATIQAALRGR